MFHHITVHVSLGYNKGFEDARACKLFKFDSSIFN